MDWYQFGIPLLNPYYHHIGSIVHKSSKPIIIMVLLFLEHKVK